MTSPMKPNKAGRRCSSPDGYGGPFPAYLSPKFDGYRATIQDGKFYSYTGKLIPNQYLQSIAWELRDVAEGMDGELTVGENFQSSAEVTQINSERKFTEFTFHVFDLMVSDSPYEDRLLYLRNKVRQAYTYFSSYARHLSLARNELCESPEEMIARYPQVRTHEGCIARSVDGLYEFGKRSKDLWKIKPEADCEAKIVGFVNEVYGQNLKTIPEDLWGTEKDRISALAVVGLSGTPFEDMEFKIGTGFSHALKRQIFENKDHFLGKLVKFKYIESGTKNKPRSPVFLGFRDITDYDPVAKETT